MKLRIFGIRQKNGQSSLTEFHQFRLLSKTAFCEASQYYEEGLRLLAVDPKERMARWPKAQLWGCKIILEKYSLGRDVA